MAVKYLVSDKSGDHLPVTGEDGKPDHRLMGAAWAALHGGYRGNEYKGPNKAEAISKLTAMYKAEKMDTPGTASSDHADLGGQWTIVSFTAVHFSADAHKSGRAEKWWDSYTSAVAASLTVIILVALFGLWWKHWRH
jgi:hypothetical protein